MSKSSTEGVLIGCDSLLISLFFFLGLTIISISNPSLSLVGDGTTISSCLSSSSSLSVTTTTDDDDGITHQLQQDFSNTPSVSEYNITIIIVNYLFIYLQRRHSHSVNDRTNSDTPQQSRRPSDTTTPSTTSNTPTITAVSIRDEDCSPLSQHAVLGYSPTVIPRRSVRE